MKRKKRKQAKVNPHLELPALLQRNIELERERDSIQKTLIDTVADLRAEKRKTREMFRAQLIDALEHVGKRLERVKRKRK